MIGATARRGRAGHGRLVRRTQRCRSRSGSSTPSAARTRQAHINREIAAALMAKADELLASPPDRARRCARQQIGLPARRLLVAAAPFFTTGQASQQQRRLRTKLAEGTSPSQTGSITATSSGRARLARRARTTSQSGRLSGQWCGALAPPCSWRGASPRLARTKDPFGSGRATRVPRRASGMRTAPSRRASGSSCTGRAAATLLGGPIRSARQEPWSDGARRGDLALARSVPRRRTPLGRSSGQRTTSRSRGRITALRSCP